LEKDIMELKSLLFEKPGPHNTDATLQIAHQRALALGIKQAVVASSHGDTARRAHSICEPAAVKGWTMSAETKAELIRLGVVVHTGVHTLGAGVGSAFSDKYGGRAPEEIVRDTLYCFSQGMKVAVECILMAADAGLLDTSREVIAVAGTDSGADTAIVCKPAHPRTFHTLEIREVLAKPRIP
jgi:hypothetical protein